MRLAESFGELAASCTIGPTLNSSHNAFNMANAHASPVPKIQEKYHITLNTLLIRCILIFYNRIFGYFTAQHPVNPGCIN